MSDGLVVSLFLERGTSGAAGPGRMRLLQTIRDAGSISAAGRRLGLSYRAAWTTVQCLNGLFGTPLVVSAAGGRRGGGAVLTEAGHQVLSEYETLCASIQESIRRLERRLTFTNAA